MSLIGYAMREAKKYYNEETYNHAARVAQYVAENRLIPEDKMDDCIALAWMHDLLEDTDYNMPPQLPGDFCNWLNMLTKSKGEDYIAYIKRIKNHAVISRESYWVKLADIKDHLAQTETLTEYLKNKYLKALLYLL